jgi:hypothetical protein
MRSCAREIQRLLFPAFISRPPWARASNQEWTTSRIGSSDLIEVVKQDLHECQQLVDCVCDRNRRFAVYDSGQGDVFLVGMGLDVDVRFFVDVEYVRAHHPSSATAIRRQFPLACIF